VDIIIRKKIPIASGLGGGSSNAATTLVTLNDMIGFHYTTEELMKIGAKIGADVPFFVFSRTAWVSGIGDRIEKACALPPLWFVLINPDFEVSTKEIYEKLNLRLTKGTIKYNVQQFRSVPRIAGSLYNDLEIVSLKTYPVLSRIKERLMVEGALGSLMSGSGPTVFGIFRNEKSATGAARELGKLNIGSVYIAHSIE
jgi:4-diphosphocytidyl-2-C-methyl-D-erythritol kinase